MTKKIAVLVRDRQSEALRMALGLTLADDVIDVYVLDRELQGTEQDTMNVELMQELDMKIYTNHEGNKTLEYLPTGEIAQRLLGYDQVLPY